MLCNETDFMYPIVADIYYPIVEQDIYGQIRKNWVFDQSVAINLNPAGTAMQEDIKAKPFVQYENNLIGRVKKDIRISKSKTNNSITNILLTNIRTCSGELIYFETSGKRENKGTIYEISTFEPIVGPFGDVEYYKLIIRRTENQGVDD